MLSYTIRKTTELSVIYLVPNSGIKKMQEICCFDIPECMVCSYMKILSIIWSNFV